MDEEEFDYDLEDNYGVMLNLDPETRVWEIKARGQASMLMFLLLDVGEHSLMNKLYEEAKFDQVIANMGEIGDGTEGQSKELC